MFIVLFRADAPGAAVREVLNRYDARIVGGMRDGAYIIEVPDPGASYALYQAFLDSLKAEPTVDLAMPYESRPVITSDGRYPTDGAGFARADWIAGSSATWTLRAIRAPLAWGCETGTYGASSTVTVAALEVMMPPSTHTDLTPSVVGGVRYGVPQPTQGPMTALARDTAQVHANGVMGHLAASGDNSQFAAGVVWAAPLVRFSNADATGRPAVPVHTIQNVVSPSVQAEGIRIINISMEWYTLNQDYLEDVTRSFRSLLSDNPNLIIVKAMANNSRTAQSTDLAEIRRMGAFNYALSILAGEGFGDRIVFVAGTAPGNTWYSQSNFIHGVTDIAAPAENVALLNLPGSATFGQFPRLHSGTSYAAPLVAGAIAQLLSMDPSLTPSQITSYLKRGAQEPKQNPTTGAVPPASDSTTWRVQGAGNRAVYQLDLYGSLTLLSRERNGTPLCGVEVVYRQQTGAVIANRPAPELILSNAPAAPVNLTDGLSVAQGGRLLAIGNQAYVFQGGAWQALSPRQGVDQIIYVERDTVFLRFTASGPRIDLHARINTGAEQQLTAGLPGGLWSPGFVTGVSGASPTGDFLHFRWTYGDGDFCTLGSIGGGGEYIARLRAGGRQVWNEWSYPECASPAPISGDPEHSLVTWRRDGAEILRAVTLLGDDSFYLKRYAATTTLSLVNTGPTYTGYIPGDIHWSPEGGRVTLRERELASSTCQLAIRAAIEPYALIEPAIALNPEACFWQPRIAPLRDQLLATLATGAAAVPRSGAKSVARAKRTGPMEHRTRAN